MMKNGRVSIVNVSILCMVVKNFMETSAAIPSISLIDNLLVILYIVCVVLLIIKKKYNLRELLLIGTISFALLYTSIVTGYSDPIISFLFIVAIKDKNIDDIICIIYKYYCAMLAVHIICTIPLALTSSICMVMHIRGIDRYTLGFIHPNAAGSKFFTIMMLYLWVKKNKKTNLFLEIIVSTGVYFLCRSRTAYMLSLMTIFIAYLMKKNNHAIDSLINKLAGVVFPSTAALIYLLIKLYETRNPLAVIVNDALSGRINLAAYALNRVGFTIFGRSIDFYGALSSYSARYAINDFTFDCIYSFIFCSMGLVYLGILSILFLKLASEKQVWINAAIIVWSLYAVTEVSGLNGFNLFPIFYLVILINGKSLKFDNQVKEVEVSDDKRYYSRL